MIHEWEHWNCLHPFKGTKFNGYYEVLHEALSNSIYIHAEMWRSKVIIIFEAVIQFYIESCTDLLQVQSQRPPFRPLGTTSTITRATNVISQSSGKMKKVTETTL